LPSIRAKFVNRLLRMTVRRHWRPDTDVPEVRRRSARIERLLERGAPSIPIEPVTVGGRPAHWYGAPELAVTGGTLLYLHGGAFCLHLPQVYGRLANSLSAATGMRVLLPDYRLAPEHRFPAAIEDCFAAYRWLVDRGVASRGFAVAGDSAGGNLTLVTLMQARDAGLPLPDCAAALSPVTDATMSGASTTYNEPADPMFSGQAMELLPGVYCPDADRADPRISPLFGDWRGLPPLLFHACSTEMLLDDSVRAQDRARAAGVAAELRVWRELPHVFHAFHVIPESREGIGDVARFVHAHTARRPALAGPGSPAAAGTWAEPGRPVSDETRAGT